MANVRIHVERVIGAVRQRFPTCMLFATGVVSKEYVQVKLNDTTIVLDVIIRVCYALHNVCDGIVPLLDNINIIIIMQYLLDYINNYALPTTSCINTKFRLIH